MTDSVTVLSDKPVQAVSRRNQLIEGLRLFGAFGVVLFHSDLELREYGAFGLVVFLILSTLWAATSKDTLLQAMKKSAPTILLPWLIWFTVFGILNVAMRRPFLETENGLILGILAGTWIHLWYLPFLAGCIVLLYQVRNRRSRASVAVLITIGFLVTANIGFIVGTSRTLPEPLAQYFVSIGAVLFGLALAARANPLLIAGLSVVGGVISFLADAGPLSFAYPVATVLVCVSLMRRDLLAGWPVHYFSQTSFGIYAMHPIFLYHVAPRLHISGYFAVVFAFFMCMATVLVTAKVWPMLARVVFLVR